MRSRLLLSALVAALSLPTFAQWTLSWELGPSTGKNPNVAHIWIPDGLKTIRGVLIAQPTMFEAGITKNDEVRAACAEKGMAVIYAECGIGLDFVTGGGDKKIEMILKGLAERTGHPEIEFAPMVTLGHSTGGIYCRNVAYWRPDRVIGVLHVMSGNLQAHVSDYTTSLKGVPVLFVNGETEQYGPDGGDLKSGLRSIFSLNPDDKTKENQSQWICMRQQILARRAKTEQNLMGLVVSRDKNHTTWEDPMNGMCADFIRDAADLRIPKGDPDGKSVVKCTTVAAEEGWLLDADIKAPKFDPAPYKDYKGDKTLALWYPGQRIATRLWKYNQQGWARPDPTADWPAEKRYTPEARLQDIVDSPPPPRLVWSGGDGIWDADKAAWKDGKGKMVAWDQNAQAVFEGPGGVVRVESKVVCSGLQLGKGYTLLVGANTVDSRWFITIDAGSTLEVTLDAKEANGRWGARIMSAGNSKYGGRLVLKGDALKDGQYNIIRSSGKAEGAWTEVVPPEGFRAEGNGWSIKLVKAIA